MEKENRQITKKKMLIGVIALGIILFAVGVSFAYYLATITGEGKKIVGKTANLDIVFTEGDKVSNKLSAPIYDSFKDSSPDVYSKKFSVENKSDTESTVDAEFDVFLKFSKLDEELKSTYIKWELLSDGSIISSGNFANANVNNELKLTNEKVFLGLDSGAKNLEFRLWMSYDENTDQNSLLGKGFSGRLKVKANEKLS